MDKAGSRFIKAMSLQKQYAAVLVLLLLLFGGFTSGMLFFVKDRQYLLAAFLVVILYFATYLIGKKISLLFLELSLLKFIRNNNGIREKSACNYFLRTQYRKKISEAEFEKLLNSIYSDLIERGAISVDSEQITLSPQQP